MDYREIRDVEEGPPMTRFWGNFRFAALAVCIGVAACGTVQAVELMAGVAKAVITNDTPRVTVNGPISEGTLKDIHARALVLNDGDSRLVIITYDLNCLDVGTAILRERALDELGLRPEQLILLATHNHNAPIQINPGNFDYGEWLANRMFDLIEEAIANERGPVTVELGSGNGYFITSTGGAPVDYEIQLLKVMDGTDPVAFFFTHGTHPLQAARKKIEPGHPGYAMDEIEARYPGVQAMYSDACGGNQFPLRPKGFESLPRRPRGDAMTESVREQAAKALGKELADAVSEIADGRLVDVTGPLSSKMEVLALPLREPISRKEALKLAKDFPGDVGFVTYPNKWRDTNWVRMLLYWYERNLPFPKTTVEMVCTDDTYFVSKVDKRHLKKYDYALHDAFPCVYEEVIVAMIGKMPLVAMQGEVCAPIGARIKDTFRRDMPIMVMSYMGEHNLYIPTREMVRRDTYQAQVIQIQYASPVGWSLDVEDEMVKGVVDLVKSVIEP